MTPVVSGPVSTILFGTATEVEVEGCHLAHAVLENFVKNRWP